MTTGSRADLRRLRRLRRPGGACTPVAHRFATRDNDPNLAARESNEAFLYADAPLAPATEYVVALEGTSDGSAFART